MVETETTFTGDRSMKNPLAGVKLFRAMCGDVVEYYDEESYTEAYKGLRRKAIREGEAIVWMDGTRTFWVDEVVFDPSKGEPEGYTWNKAGKQKHIRYEVNSTAPASDGSNETLSKVKTGIVWKEF
jgi:hypothetical protein